MRERCLVLLKPDALMLGLKQEIENRLREAGLAFMSEKELLLTRSFILRWRNWDHYAESFWRHVDFVTSSPVIVQIWEGADAVYIVREVKKRIRLEFAESPEKNVMHSPDTTIEAEDEINLFFSEKE